MSILKEFVQLFVETNVLQPKFLYAYVPTSVVPMVKKYGLLAGRSLLNNPEAIKELANTLGISPLSVRHAVHRAGNEHLGPKILFQPPPSKDILSPNHPNKIRPSTLIRIDWKALSTDFPEARIWGMSIFPASHEDEANRWLTPAEVENYMNSGQEEIWQAYDDPDDSGLFAPGVPHGRISIDGEKVPPEYLRFGS